MVALRITKYNPKFRSANGAYTRNEWISASDIGRTFDDGPLTLEQYLATEDAYVHAVMLFVEKHQIKSLRISYLEDRAYFNSPAGSEDQNKLWLKDVSLGREYSGESLAKLIRLNLRKACWTKLEGEHGAYVHFGYDYYMYAGVNSKSKVSEINFPSLIYIENFESPYHHLDVDDED